MTQNECADKEAAEKNKDNIVLRTPNIKDAAGILSLVEASPPLDRNSSYLYMLLCLHFNETCLVAENSGNIVGFVSAYRPPNEPDSLFVWQIAIHESVRGQGWGKKMLHSIIKRDACQGVRFITLSISPSNQASLKLFQSFAWDLKFALRQEGTLEQNLFTEKGHEEEVVYRIGPLS